MDTYESVLSRDVCDFMSATVKELQEKQTLIIIEEQRSRCVRHIKMLATQQIQ